MNPSSQPVLAVHALSAGYGKLVILHEISLTVDARQFVAILGPNGSGKSTLLKSVFGLTAIFAGDIRLNNIPLAALPTERIAAQGIAYIPQRENVFTSMSVLENLQLAVRNQRRPAAKEALDAALEHFPILRTRMQQRAGQLSGGERQMLAIAIGWLARPTIMLLDEPSAGLAPRFVTEVFRTLQKLAASGITMVVVEQNARSVLRWCDYAYVLREGRVAFQGSAAAILADEETVKSYIGVRSRPASTVDAPESQP